MKTDSQFRNLCLLVCIAMLAVFAVAMFPQQQLGKVPGPFPDSYDYVYGAEALLNGHYTVSYTDEKAHAFDGTTLIVDGSPRVPRYPPGMSMLLVPFVALGGIDAAVWLSYLIALVIGILMVFIAFRLERPIAAPLALMFGLYTAAVAAYVRIVMSDLPTVALVLAIAALLVTGGKRCTIAAGIIAGLLPVMRIASLPLTFAGLLSSKRRWLAYITGTLPFLAFLAIWQWVVYGSPFATGYHRLESGQGVFSSLFALQYAFGLPGATDEPGLSGISVLWHLPNALAYIFQMAGRDAFICWPFVAVLGFGALLTYSRRDDAMGVFARFSLGVVILSYLTYLFYYYQSARFLLPAATLLSLAASIGLVDIIIHFAANQPSRTFDGSALNRPGSVEAIVPNGRPTLSEPDSA